MLPVIVKFLIFGVRYLSKVLSHTRIQPLSVFCIRRSRVGALLCSEVESRLSDFWCRLGHVKICYGSRGSYHCRFQGRQRKAEQGIGRMNRIEKRKAVPLRLSAIRILASPPIRKYLRHPIVTKKPNK